VIDLHTHLVPDFDDGVATVDEARRALRALWDAGVRTAVATPHFLASTTRRPDALRDDLDVLDRQWRALREAARQSLPQLDIRRGIELRLDAPDPDLSDPRLRLDGGAAVLVEFDGFMIPLRAEEVIAGLRADGWTVILAHPERYRDAPVERIRAIRDAGCRLQLNAGSLTGQYGPGPRGRAWTILAEGLGAVVASDYHGYRDPQMLQARREVERRMGEDAARRLFESNPWRLLEGAPPRPVATAPDAPGVLDRIVDRLGFDGK
jgi:protein-tyrosine phosphatase